MGFIVLGIIYYVLSSLLFLKLIDNEYLIGSDRFGIVISLIPIIRFIYYIYLKI